MQAEKRLALASKTRLYELAKNCPHYTAIKILQVLSATKDDPPPTEVSDMFKIGDRVFNSQVSMPMEGPRDNWNLPVGWYTVVQVDPNRQAWIGVDYNSGYGQQIPEYARYHIDRFKRVGNYIALSPKNYPHLGKNHV